MKQRDNLMNQLKIEFTKDEVDGQSFVQPKISGLAFLVDQGIAKKHNEKLP